MEVRDHLDAARLDPVDDPVPAHDHLARASLVELRNGPSRLWKGGKALDGREDSANDQVRVHLRVLRDVAPDRFYVV